ncbi:MAG TPA: hypothetical protein P5308_05325 [Syntrophales bacterium]|nr:hypothetical protein [Syntrophales bacterium]
MTPLTNPALRLEERLVHDGSRLSGKTSGTIEETANHAKTMNSEGNP